MDANVQADINFKALRKITAALDGLKHKPVVIGSFAYQAWGAKIDPKVIELMIPSGEPHRQAIFGAARGEGFQQLANGGVDSTPERTILRLRYNDPKLGGSVDVDLHEAATPFQKGVLTRALPGGVLQLQVLIAKCEDLIIYRAGSAAPEDREAIVALLRGAAGKIDAQYLKKEAEAAGVFDKVKTAWQDAKKTP